MQYKTLGDRMKSYENAYRFHLTERLPIVLRCDGVAFHTYTRGFKKPFDEIFMKVMQETTKHLCENIMGCKFGFVQSDEISLVLTNNDTRDTQSWFDNNLNKLVSVSASMATLAFNKSFSSLVLSTYDDVINDRSYTEDEKDEIEKYWDKYFKKFDSAYFDSRAFILPLEEVNNYFIWRQQDCTRNSILSVAQSLFSEKEIHGIKCNELQNKMLLEKNTNWNNYPTYQKRGTCFYRKEEMKINKQTNIEKLKKNWVIDTECPIFSQDPSYINSQIGVFYD